MIFDSRHLKTAILAYYRFKKGAVCADEVFDADVLIDTGKEIIEVECKISKSDLKADAKKEKHKQWKGETPFRKHQRPNKFYICVPTELVEAAKKFVEEVNPNYGIIELSNTKYDHWYRYTRGWDNMLYFVKKAKNLHKEYISYQECIALRLCSKIINSNIEGLQEYHRNQKKVENGQPGILENQS